MKSRTLSCEQTVLYKDFTRFAPSWILYSIFLLLVFMVCCRSGEDWRNASYFASIGSFMAIINFIYGLLNAQLLFGDLFSSRMTNSLHALPLRRETWFGCHTLAGIAFALIPNLLFMLGMFPACACVPSLPALMFINAMGQYLFFFGLGIFCMILTGSRFAGVVVYGLTNFGSLLVWWMAEELYIPLLPSVVTVSNNYVRFSPVVWASGWRPYNYSIGKIEQMVTVHPEGMAYLGAIALVGLALIVAALLLYRVRHLESAGDFLAVKWMKPVFLVIYSLMVGMACQGILGALTSTDWVYLIIGILIGYFTGQMLLMRTTKILSKKTFLGLAALLGALGLSLWITWLDPLGIKAWVPEPEQVRQVSVNYSETENPEIIEEVIALHENMAQNLPLTGIRDYPTASVSLTYTMKDGSQVSRSYALNVASHMDTVRKILSHPEFVFGDLLEIWDDAWLQASVEDGEGRDIILGREKWMELKEVLLLDCQAGTMSQHYASHNQSPVYSFSIQYRDGDRYTYYHINIYPEAENTLAWLKQQSFYKGYTGK